MKKRLMLSTTVFVFIVIGVFAFSGMRGPTHRGLTVSYWLKKIGHYTGTTAESTAAANALETIGPDAIPQIIKTVNESSFRQEEFYRELWKKLSQDIKNHLPEPVTETEMIGLQMNREITASKALRAIGQSGIPYLAATLKDDSPVVREASVNTLRFFHEDGYDISEFIPLLIELLEDADAGVQQDAATALGELGTGSMDAVPMLLKLMDHSQTGRIATSKIFVRGEAAAAMGKIGIASAPVIAKLREASENVSVNPVADKLPVLLASPDNYTAIQATVALWRLTGETTNTVQHLLDLWSPMEGFSIAPILTAFGEMGADAEGAVPFLISQMGSHSASPPFLLTQLRPLIAEALEKIDSDYLSKVE